MHDFKSLPLDQELLDGYVQEFTEQFEYRIDSREPTTQGNGNTRLRFRIGRKLVASALVDFLFNSDGTTTIYYKQGSNQDLGYELAQFIFNKINPNEFEVVEMTIQHLTIEDVAPLLLALQNDKHEDDSSMFEYIIEHDSEIFTQIRLTSIQHKDKLVIKHHKTTNNLQIQGKPLFCYKRLTYHFIDFLDILNIEKILSRTDSNNAQIVSTDVATHMLSQQFPNIFQKAPEEIQRLILSGLCVALASPKLPDYSMLVYPDLRALEGALHDGFKAYGLYSSNYSDNGSSRVGVLFHKKANETYTVRDEHVEIINNPDMIAALSKGYNTYSGKRNPLFHLQEELLFSTFISDLPRALNLSNDVKQTIEEIYKYRP